MNDKTANFWKTHLATTDSPAFHFVPANILDIDSLKQAAEEIDFAFFVIEAYNVNSELALMDEFAKSMHFPSYFGRNWDALVDLMEDLSWVKAQGYVLLTTGGKGLLSLQNGVFSSLIGVLEATVRDWRDERGEYGERTAPVAFHVIFSDDESIKESILGELREAMCEHLEEGGINIYPAPVRLRMSAIYKNAEDLVSSGAAPEVVLSFLREQGMDELDSMYSIAGLTGTSVSEAKSLIYNSQTWSEVRKRDEQIRNAAQDALRDLGLSDD